MKRFFAGLILFIVFAVIAVIFSAVKEGASSNIDIKVKIREAVFEVEIANTAIRQSKGLSGRDNLETNKGMLFVFNNAGSYGFWMKNMKFPIDIIWLKDNKIIGFEENVSPASSNNNLETFYPPSVVDKVLEINAGAVSRFGIRIGDLMEVL